MRTILISALLLNVVGCSPKEKKPEPDGRSTATAAELSVAEANNRFALNLYKELRTSRQGNLVFSPLCIYDHLAMLSSASGAGGEQIAQAVELPFSGIERHSAIAALTENLHPKGVDVGFTFELANQLWGQPGTALSPDFLALASKQYGVNLEEVDITGQPERAQQAINAWFAEHSKGRIRNLVPRDAPSGALLASTCAAYFQGGWVRPFEKDLIRPATFHVTSRKSVRVPLMNETNWFNWQKVNGLQVLELQYLRGGTSMFVLLPDTADGLVGLQERLSWPMLKRMVTGMEYREVVVSLPRFEFTSAFQLQNELSALGMAQVFQPETGVAGASPRESLHLTDVFHAAYISVDEEGTEAAAGTASYLLDGAETPPNFRADHPFLFVIMDKRSSAILFLGRVVNPAEKPGMRNPRSRK